MLGMGPKQATLQNVVPSCPTPSTRPEVCPWSIETLGSAAFLAACLLLWRLRTRLGGALLLAWGRRRSRRGWWALLNLLGGAVLSVLPLPFLPFVPEQSLRHYSFHLPYGLTQVPLIVAARTQLKAR